MPGDVEANGAGVSDVVSDTDMEPDEIDQKVKDDGDKMPEQHTSPETGPENSTETKKKYDPKDPHRPRRKKARRACYACQRAHLTCGKSQPLHVNADNSSLFLFPPPRLRASASPPLPAYMDPHEFYFHLI